MKRSPDYRRILRTMRIEDIEDDDLCRELQEKLHLYNPQYKNSDSSNIYLYRNVQPIYRIEGMRNLNIVNLDYIKYIVLFVIFIIIIKINI